MAHAPTFTYAPTLTYVPKLTYTPQTESDEEFEDSLTISGTCINNTVSGLLSNHHESYAVMLAMISELAELAIEVGADPAHVSEMVVDHMSE